jgi:hypothetical protein
MSDILERRIQSGVALRLPPHSKEVPGRNEIQSGVALGLATALQRGEISTWGSKGSGIQNESWIQSEDDP